MSLRNVPSGKMGWGFNGLSGAGLALSPHSVSSMSLPHCPSVGPGAARALEFQNYQRLGEPGKRWQSSRGEFALGPPEPLGSSGEGGGRVGLPEAGCLSKAKGGGQACPLPRPGLSGSGLGTESIF